MFYPMFKSVAVRQMETPRSIFERSKLWINETEWESDTLVDS